MTLKEKTVNGLFWSFIDNFAKNGIAFVVGIILARLLTPREFGLIGMITIFIAVSQPFIDGGFSQALIRKQDCTQADYSTVFYFNLFISILFYLLLFFSAGAISEFFNEPQLKMLVQVLGISLIISALTIIQRIQLTKRIDFKLQTKISVIASILSGIIGIGLAYSGYGVWSLVFRSLSGLAFTSLLLCLWNRWVPSLLFSIKSFRDLFSFGSKLLMSSLINKTYENIYNLIIAKYFSASDLGFYSRADGFKKLPSENLSRVIQQVSYPVLAIIQDDIPKLKLAYAKLIKSTMLISFILMIGMAAVAKPMIITVIGEKWLPSVVYLQLLCFVGMFIPLHSLNLNMLKVQGRSNLILRLEIIKKIIAIPIIIICVFFGIKVMIMGMIVISLIAYYLNSYWSGELIDYSMFEQLKDILPSFLLALFMGSVVYMAGLIIKTSPPLTLIIQISLGALLSLGLSEMFKLKEYLYIKEIFIKKLKETIVQ